LLYPFALKTNNSQQAVWAEKLKSAKAVNKMHSNGSHLNCVSSDYQQAFNSGVTESITVIYQVKSENKPHHIIFIHLVTSKTVSSHNLNLCFYYQSETSNSRHMDKTLQKHSFRMMMMLNQNRITRLHHKYRRNITSSPPAF